MEQGLAGAPGNPYRSVATEDGNCKADDDGAAAAWASSAVKGEPKMVPLGKAMSAEQTPMTAAAG